MKKLGISLVGISHLQHGGRWPISRSYLDCKDNFISEIQAPACRIFEVKKYLTTYFSDETQNIVSFYSPYKSLFLRFEQSHQIKTLIDSLNLLEDQDLDYVIITRFDIFFQPNAVKNFAFDTQKFNFLCREKDHWDNFKFVNDCFYFFPFNMLPKLKAACIDLYNNPPRPGLMDMHGLYKHMVNHIGEHNIHFITDEHHLSSGNTIYSLKRRN